MSEYYTKEEIDALLANKANITALTNFYDRMTVDALLQALRSSLKKETNVDDRSENS